jgi:alcohol dehydrogenase class IV
MTIAPGEMAFAATERVVFGRPAAEAIAQEAERRGAARVFILASRHLNTRTDEIARIRAALGDRHAATHDGMPPHAPRSAVLEAAAAARNAGADLIVTVGGGSVTDAGKILALCLKHGVKAHEDFDRYRIRVENGRVVKPDFAPPDVRVVCVPTTLSGGEFNALSGATDERAKMKQGYEHRLMAPAAVILDPALTVHTPEWLWLSTGIRALDHAMETLASFASNPVADAMAEAAIRLLAEGLPRSKADPGDLDGRLKCQMGAWQSMLPIVGGIPMGGSHAIGHVLGGTADVPHGYTSCVMSPYVLAWNAGVNGERQKRISAAFGRPDRPASELADAFIAGLGMPRRLRDVGLKEDQLQRIAEASMHDIWIGTNPRPISGPADVMEILQRAW